MVYIPLKHSFSQWRDENTQSEDFSLFERQFFGE